LEDYILFISLYDLQHVIFDDGSRAGRREVKSTNPNYINRDVFQAVFLPGKHRDFKVTTSMYLSN